MPSKCSSTCSSTSRSARTTPSRSSSRGPARAVHELAHLPGVLAVEPVRMVPARLRAGHRTRQPAITGLDERLAPAARRRYLACARSSARRWPRAVGQACRNSGCHSGRRPAGGAARRLATREDREGCGHRRRIHGHVRLHGDRRLAALPARKAQRCRAPLSSSTRAIRRDLYRRIKATPAVAGVSSKRAAIDNFRDTLAQNMNVMVFFNVLFSRRHRVRRRLQRRAHLAVGAQPRARQPPRAGLHARGDLADPAGRAWR